MKKVSLEVENYNEMSLFLQVGKKTLSPNGEPIPFMSSLALAAVAGFSGGIVGTPGDMINVRMQNDIKLPVDQRRKWVNFKNICFVQCFEFTNRIN